MALSTGLQRSNKNTTLSTTYSSSSPDCKTQTEFWNISERIITSGLVFRCPEHDPVEGKFRMFHCKDI